jgi:hypothetical protein
VLQRLRDAARGRRGAQDEPDPLNESSYRPDQRVELRVLLLSADGREPAYAAWVAALKREGVPFDAVVAQRGHIPINAEMLTAGDEHARYQAVIVAVGGLPCFDGVQYISALTSDEWKALEDFERDFSIRRITGFAYPSSAYGLDAPTISGSTEGIAGTLTAAGHLVFSELRGPVPLDPNAYGHLAKPADAGFTTLVAGPQGTALVGVQSHPDGREDLVSTVDGNAAMIHVQLLCHGMLRWVTRGVYLGRRRHYLTVHVDDVFLSDDAWDPESASTVPADIRMQPDDVEAAVRWSRERGVRLDLCFNGHGAELPDSLTAALLAHKDEFRWINHTFSHHQLDEADAATLHTEICANVEFAVAAGLPIDATELVTGGHSGLDNAELPGVVAQAGVRWIAADNSRDPAPRAIGPARTVGRHPTNMYFNVSTRRAQLDEYHHLFLVRAGGEQPQGTRTRLAPATSWSHFLDSEAQTILGHIVTNDPRPHFVHQSNLTDDRMLYDLLDRALARHQELFCLELTQPAFAEIGAELLRREAWGDALRRSTFTAFVQDGQLHLECAEPVQIPLTGASPADPAEAGEESAWMAPIGPQDGHVVCTLA